MDISTTAMPPRTIIGIREADTDPGVLFPKATEQVFAFIAEHGLQPIGALTGVYYHVEDGRFDMAVAVPVASAPASVEDPFFVGEIGAERAVVGDFIGSYDGLPDAWGELMSAPAVADGTPTMPCWEEYVAGPESTQDPSTWRTLLVQPVA